MTTKVIVQVQCLKCDAKVQVPAVAEIEDNRIEYRIDACDAPPGWIMPYDYVQFIYCPEHA